MHGRVKVSEKTGGLFTMWRHENVMRSRDGKYSVAIPVVLSVAWTSVRACVSVCVHADIFSQVLYDRAKNIICSLLKKIFRELARSISDKMLLNEWMMAATSCNTYLSSLAGETYSLETVYLFIYLLILNLCVNSRSHMKWLNCRIHSTRSVIASKQSATDRSRRVFLTHL